MASKPKVVYLVCESAERSHWARQGVLSSCKDGSLNLRLDLLPGVALNIRDPKSAEDEPEE